MVKVIKRKEKIYDLILRELFEIRNPHVRFSKRQYYKIKKKIDNQAKRDTPTKQMRLPLPSKKAFFDLTTARNRDLINIDEQNQLRKTVVGFFGLSVGSHAVLTWMMQSRADVVKIVDPSMIAPSNLNRLRFGWNEIGKRKIDVIKDKLLDINPFVKVIATTKVDKEAMENIFAPEFPLDVVVDEIDDFKGKVFLRKLAKRHKIPLLSAADVGDNVILDVERYDLDPQLKPFLGRIESPESIDFSSLSGNERKKLIIQLVGFERASERMIESIMAIGGTIPTWPQLGATATMAGGIVTTTIKKIVLGEKVKSGRYCVSLDEILVEDFNSKKRKRDREVKVKQVNHILQKF